MKAKTIDIVPFGGLGNRMRVLNSIGALQAKADCEVELIWLIKAELNAPFSSLFKSASFPFTIANGLKYTLFLKFVKHIFIDKYTSIYRFILGLFYDLVLFDEDVLNISENQLLNLIKDKKKILISTCYAFFDFPSFDNFTPSDSVQQKLNSLELPKDLIGIHIRRTDHVEIIKDSSLDSYSKAIEEEISKNKTSTFYLATDDYEVKEYYKKKLKKQLITQDFELARDSETGIENALIDILALSKCTKLICNSKSSFVVTAQRIAKTKEIIEI
ncbi:hypothetical protein [Arcticibacterium luteifluviistationis]|uniref:Alpha-(1,6)-fucosyltransferase N- and catalytic domain-containing protein n=1 Tax=Arcticibacterium luteifluviistationis TaxID=1784714 RepID=A0A2Z4GF53_9BACT|nr:hypothetical protein [Arcticibacterium luteifluviistationis]AWV99687.1 hypothetical protein DJ013_16510 [Arcticibacterium luteifluviistationis]